MQKKRLMKILVNWKRSFLTLGCANYAILAVVVIVGFVVTCRDWGNWGSAPAFPHHGDLKWRGRLQVGGGVPSAMCLSQDGRLLGIATRDRDSAVTTISLWNTTTATQFGATALPDWDVSSLSFSPDGHRLLCGVNRTAIYSIQAGLRLFDIRNGMLLNKQVNFGPDGSEIISLAFSPDGQTAAVLEHDGILRLWNLKQWQEAAVLVLDGSGAQYSTFSPNGATLAVAMNHDLKLLDMKSCTWEHTLGKKQFGVMSVSFARDSSTLATIENDMTIKLWDVKKGELKETLRTSYDSAEMICFVHSDEKLLAFGKKLRIIPSIGISRNSSAPVDVEEYGWTVDLYGVREGRFIATLVGPMDHFAHAEYCSKQSLLATSTYDSDGATIWRTACTVDLWELSRDL